ncbi:MAG TPA: ribosome maturation factor RimM [Candidatus Binataceae bacterium]|nr:ribosome maturation factor RimM [Candidatus Binataceae bacterium]
MVKRRTPRTGEAPAAARRARRAAAHALRAPTAEGLLRIGYVAGSHGVRGALRVRTDDPGSTTISSVGRLFVETPAGRREFNVLEAHPLGAGHHRVVLEGLADADAAEALRGAAAMIAIADLPPLKEGEFYYYQLAGVEVLLTDGRRLGTIEDVLATGAHDIWVVRAGEREVLVPVISDVVKAMDLGAHRVTIDPIPGLLD